ncbi:hypothetical protein [Fulvivirga lutimaris]|uniref:hypothetical protein n=1 Tax=Fulvivirga lutimaris TaxID=1819566 RepID=UPI0012BC5964|nr:hypothetical protein [Fulvivirga lutimaris]
MLLLKLKNNLFHRFGSRYGSLFDGNHFLGRNSFDANWLTKDKPKAKKGSKNEKPEAK